jgi:hypothetical protein
MNTPRLLGFTFALASLVAGTAHAQDGLTRGQVAAETHAAQRAGAIPHGDLDVSSLSPSGDTHPAQSTPITLTRAQVKAELVAAIAAGQVPTGETGQTPADVNPSRYPHESARGLTREQVRRELEQAQRDGDFEVGETGLTAAQVNPSRYAQARARDGEVRYVLQ